MSDPSIHDMYECHPITDNDMRYSDMARNRASTMRRANSADDGFLAIRWNSFRKKKAPKDDKNGSPLTDDSYATLQNTRKAILKEKEIWEQMINMIKSNNVTTNASAREMLNSYILAKMTKDHGDSLKNITDDDNVSGIEEKDDNSSSAWATYWNNIRRAKSSKTEERQTKSLSDLDYDYEPSAKKNSRRSSLVQIGDFIKNGFKNNDKNKDDGKLTIDKYFERMEQYGNHPIIKVKDGNKTWRRSTISFGEENTRSHRLNNKPNRLSLGTKQING